MALDHVTRGQGIGGSELAAILGLDPYKTPLDVWLDKTGRAVKFEGNEATFRGNALEDAIGLYMERELGSDWERMPTQQLIHPKHPICRGNPDRIFRHVLTGEMIGGELKSTIEKVTEDDLIDPENPKKLPWLFQCQWYMGLTGLNRWELGWMGAYFNYTQITVNYNESLFAALIEFAEDWWRRHIVADVAPDPTNSHDVELLWPNGNGEWFNASFDLQNTICKLSAVKAEIKMLKAKESDLSERIKLAFGASSVACFEGERIATYVADKNGNRTLRLKI